MDHHSNTRLGAHALVLLLTALLALGCIRPVLAEESQLTDLQNQADSLVERIETTTQAYQAAAAEVESLEQEIAQNEARASELESLLPAQRARTAASIKSLYLFHQSTNSLLSIALSSEDFGEFLRKLRYIDIVHERNLTEIQNLSRMDDELTQRRALLDTEYGAAVQKRQDALDALSEAREVRAELQAHAIAIAMTEANDREAAIAIAQQAIQQAAEASAGLPGEAQQAATFTTSSGNTAVVQVPETTSVSTDPLLTNTTAAETDDWAARINAYLAGSPLEGYGEAFAEAAANYGVDPRLSPAIAMIESTKGEYCFEEHNAWGWGSSSWDSWEEAINDHVEGLANIYDGTLTLEGAEMYCPPNYQEWYSSVASEMDSL